MYFCKKKDMLQRIQSLYLLAVIIAYVLLFFFPIAEFSVDTTVNYFSLLRITSANSNSTYPFIIAVVVLCTAVLVCIFMYKKRTLQIKMTAIILLAHIALVAAMFYAADTIAKKLGAIAAYDTGAYLALMPMVFLVLAHRAIRKDEKMIRSTDRIR